MSPCNQSTYTYGYHGNQEYKYIYHGNNKYSYHGKQNTQV